MKKGGEIIAIALYARKSVERENSVSCKMQIDYCETLIRPEEKDEEIIKYIDDGFSGGNTDRDAFREMMRQVEKGAIKKIIVYRLDRISRSLTDFVGILDTLKKHQVSFFSTQESFDTSTPYGEMIVKILMVFAEFERQSIIDRVTQAYAHRAEKGLYMGGRRPYGFDLEETVIHGIKTKMLVPNVVEVEHVKYIFESYAVSGVTLRHLMNLLVQSSILPLDGSWSTAKLSTILKNPIYVKADNDIYEYYIRHNTNVVSEIAAFDGIHGAQLYGKSKHKTDDFSDMKLVVMTHEGIVSSETWLKCRKKLEANRQLGRSLSNDTSWLGGKLICKSCGRTMTVTKGGKRLDGTQTRYFSCTGKSHHRSCKGVNVPLYADSLEDMVNTLIADKLSKLKPFHKKHSGDVSNQRNLFKNRISEIEVDQEKLVKLMLQDHIESDMIKLLNERAKKLSDEKQKILAKLTALAEEETEVIDVSILSKKWKTAVYEERKTVAGLLIDGIYIDEDGTTEIVWNI